MFEIIGDGRRDYLNAFVWRDIREGEQFWRYANISRSMHGCTDLRDTYMYIGITEFEG